MLTWVVYDIVKDRTRTKIAKRCLDYGLYRVQKSVFLGDIEGNRVEEIILLSKELMEEITAPGTGLFPHRTFPRG
jgi:CRISPR-associated protein Cas2